MEDVELAPVFSAVAVVPAVSNEITKPNLIATIIKAFKTPHILGEVLGANAPFFEYAAFFKLLGIFVENHERKTFVVSTEGEINSDAIKASAEKHDLRIKAQAILAVKFQLDQVIQIFQALCSRRDEQPALLAVAVSTMVEALANNRGAAVRVAWVSFCNDDIEDRELINHMGKPVMSIDGTLYLLSGIDMTQSTLRLPLIFRRKGFKENSEFSGKYDHFQEEEAVQDNDSGFRVLQASREQVCSALLDAIALQAYRSELAEEIFNYLYDLELKAQKKIRSEAEIEAGGRLAIPRDLFDVLNELSKFRAEYQASNVFPVFSDVLNGWLHAKELKFVEGSDVLKFIDRAIDVSKQEIIARCSSPEVCKKYVREYVKNRQSCLGRHSMKLYAAHKKIRLFSYDCLKVSAENDHPTIVRNDAFSFGDESASEVLHVVFRVGNGYNCLQPLIEIPRDHYKDVFEKIVNAYIDEKLKFPLEIFFKSEDLSSDVIGQKLAELERQNKAELELNKRRLVSCDGRHDSLCKELASLKSKVAAKKRDDFDGAGSVREFLIKEFSLVTDLELHRASGAVDDAKKEALLCINLDINEIIDEDGNNLLSLGIESQVRVAVLENLLKLGCSMFQVNTRINSLAPIKMVALYRGHDGKAEEDSYKKEAFKQMLRYFSERYVFSPRHKELLGNVMLQVMQEFCVRREEDLRNYASKFITKMEAQRNFILSFIIGALRLFGLRPDLEAERANDLANGMLLLDRTADDLEVIDFWKMSWRMLKAAERGPTNGSEFWSTSETTLIETEKLIFDNKKLLEAELHVARQALKKKAEEAVMKKYGGSFGSAERLEAQGRELQKVSAEAERYKMEVDRLKAEMEKKNAELDAKMEARNRQTEEDNARKNAEMEAKMEARNRQIEEDNARKNAERDASMEARNRQIEEDNARKNAERDVNMEAKIRQIEADNARKNAERDASLEARISRIEEDYARRRAEGDAANANNSRDYKF